MATRVIAINSSRFSMGYWFRFNAWIFSSMTWFTSTGQQRVIWFFGITKIRGSHMTNITWNRSRYMVTWFSFCCTTVMAIWAGSCNYAIMVHRCATKGSRALMASLARCCGLDMRTGFTWCSATVMAVGAAAGDTGVVHGCTGKCGGALMAGLARRSCLDMATWFA